MQLKLSSKNCLASFSNMNKKNNDNYSATAMNEQKQEKIVLLITCVLICLVCIFFFRFLVFIFFILSVSYTFLSSYHYHVYSALLCIIFRLYESRKTFSYINAWQGLSGRRPCHFPRLRKPVTMGEMKLCKILNLAVELNWLSMVP